MLSKIEQLQHHVLKPWRHTASTSWCKNSWRVHKDEARITDACTRMKHHQLLCSNSACINTIGDRQIMSIQLDIHVHTRIYRLEEATIHTHAFAGRLPLLGELWRHHVCGEKTAWRQTCRAWLPRHSQPQRPPVQPPPPLLLVCDVIASSRDVLRHHCQKQRLDEVLEWRNPVKQASQDKFITCIHHVTDTHTPNAPQLKEQFDCKKAAHIRIWHDCIVLAA